MLHRVLLIHQQHRQHQGSSSPNKTPEPSSPLAPAAPAVDTNSTSAANSTTTTITSRPLKTAPPSADSTYEVPVNLSPGVKDALIGFLIGDPARAV